MSFNLLQFLDRYILKPSNRYRLVTTLKGHKGPINCFAFNNDGSLLASGGDDEVIRVWDVNYLQCIQIVADRNCRWGQITCLKFIPIDAVSDWMCFGTGRGRLLVYRRLRKTKASFTEISCTPVFTPGDSVESFSFDSVHHRLIVTSHFGQIKMYEVNGGMVVDLWTEEMSDAIPRATLFLDKGNSVIVYGLETGRAICRDSQTATEKFSRNLMSPIGNIGICPVYGNILVDNMTNGFDLYNPSRTAPSKSFVVPTTKMFAKKGVFGEKGHTVVTGSDHGKVYVFGVSNTESMQRLEHGSESVMIQAVETTTVSDRHLICSGSSESCSSIRIWEKPVRNTQHAPAQQGRINSLTLLMFFNVIVMALFWSASTWAPTLQVKIMSAADVVSDFVKTERAAIFDGGPELPKHKLSEPDPATVEKLLNMDEETFRKLFNIPKVDVPRSGDIQRSGDQEMNEGIPKGTQRQLSDNEKSDSSTSTIPTGMLV